MCEADKAFIRGKLCVKEHRGELRVSCMEWKWLRSLMWGSHLHCLWPVILLMPIFGLTQGTSRYICASFSQDGFHCKGFWEVSRTYYGLVTPSLLWLMRIFSAHEWVWSLLTTRIRKTVPHFELLMLLFLNIV